jgi:hypothetical protein
MTQDEERVWQYIVAHKEFDANVVAEHCKVDKAFAQSCINRIATPLNVFKEELEEPELLKRLYEDNLGRRGRVNVDPTRVRTLRTAIDLTAGDRNKSYGPPFDNLSDCAHLVNAYINAKQSCIRATGEGYEVYLTAEDIAWIMVLVKAARSFQPGYHPDNYTDAAAYSAIAGECREIQIEETGAAK